MLRLVFAVLSLALAACSSTEGYPDNPLADGDDISMLKPSLSSKKFEAYSAASGDAIKRKTIRNEILFARLAAYDYEYAQFQQSINRERTVGDTAGDFANLALTATGASVVSSATKTALAASSTAVTGAKLSVDKNLFYDKTMPALFAQMEANRSTIRVLIVNGAQRSDDEYPLAQGLADLYQYREAGSIPGALSGITKSAGNQSATAQMVLFRMRGVQGIQ